jgi:hypothetical protein
MHQNGGGRRIVHMAETRFRPLHALRAYKKVPHREPSCYGKREGHFTAPGGPGP